MAEASTGAPGQDRFVWVPVRLRRVCLLSALAVLVVFAFIAVFLDAGAAGSAGVSNSGGGIIGRRFGTADRIGFFAIGVLMAAAIALLGRPRLVADRDGVRVRNIVGSHVVPWAVVVAVRYDDGASWPSLELRDDETLPLMAVQAADGQRAHEAVAHLRRLLDASRQPARQPPTSSP